jgi:hypothetical protein
LTSRLRENDLHQDLKDDVPSQLLIVVEAVYAQDLASLAYLVDDSVDKELTAMISVT